MLSIKVRLTEKAVAGLSDFNKNTIGGLTGTVSGDSLVSVLFSNGEGWSFSASDLEPVYE